MIKFLKSLFGIESTTPVATPAPVNNSVPYKVPEPAATTPIPLVVEAAPAKAPAKPKVAKPKAAAIKAPAKAPAKPKAPATKKPKISIAK